MSEALSTAVQTGLKFIRFSINALFVVTIVGLLATLIVNFIMSIQGFAALMLPWEESIIRDIYLLINIWSPINFGLVFNHIILIATLGFGISIFIWVQRMFNDSYGAI